MQKFISRLLVVAALACTTAFAQAQEFTAIQPAQPTDSPGKIEVLEFFSYGCNHCRDFHPKISAWAAKLPSDVVFKRVPVSFGRLAWANLARLYYALETTGDLARLDSDIFRALHDERVNLQDEKSMNTWLAGKSINSKKFADAYGSFSVISKQKRADQMVQSYRIPAVPAITVEGKYLVGGKDFDEALAITDKLIAKIRAERGKK